MKTLDDYLNEQLQDTEFRKEWEKIKQTADDDFSSFLNEKKQNT